MKLVACKFLPSLFCFVLRVPTTVPADVFAPNSAWSGFYEYLGKRQTTTFTVTDFNASSGRVNVTLLESSGVSIRMSGKEHMMTFRVRPCPHMQGHFSTYFISLGIRGKSPIKWCRVWPSLQAGLHTRMPISAHPVLRCSEHSRCRMASSCVMLSPARKVKTFIFDVSDDRQSSSVSQSVYSYAPVTGWSDKCFFQNTRLYMDQAWPELLDSFHYVTFIS